MYPAAAAGCCENYFTRSSLTALASAEWMSLRFPMGLDVSRYQKNANIYQRRMFSMSQEVNAAAVKETAQPVQGKRTHVRFVVLFVVCLIYLITYLDRVNISIAAPLMMAEFGLNKVEWGLSPQHRRNRSERHLIKISERNLLPHPLDSPPDQLAERRFGRTRRLPSTADRQLIPAGRTDLCAGRGGTLPGHVRSGRPHRLPVRPLKDAKYTTGYTIDIQKHG